MNDRLVQPLFEPGPDNADGAFYVVKDACMLCALPVETATSSMSWNRCPKTREEGEDFRSLRCRVHKQPETEEELRAMVDAAIGSCVQAIRYRGTDARILALFREAKLEVLCDALCTG